MNYIKPLPSFLLKRYNDWKDTKFQEKKALFENLVDEGQHPSALVIACCDSRVNVSSLFGADVGEFFVHRNIANLVPKFTSDSDCHGTSAALEYAVTALGVSHIMIIGHSHCGGVNGCHKMCSGKAPELKSPNSFVGRWIENLRPGYERVVAKGGTEDEQIDALEREGVLLSLENLMTFPFVKERVAAESLTLHGLWMDLRGGGLETYNPTISAFEPV